VSVRYHAKSTASGPSGSGLMSVVAEAGNMTATGVLRSNDQPD
jgi:hypothetical protein